MKESERTNGRSQALSKIPPFRWVFQTPRDGALTMTTNDQPSRRRSGLTLMFLLFTSAVFMLAVSDVVGYLMMALAPIAGAIKTLGYPETLGAIDQRMNDR